VDKIEYFPQSAKPSAFLPGDARFTHSDVRCK